VQPNTFPIGAALNESICPQCNKTMALLNNVYECSRCQTSILALSSINVPVGLDDHRFLPPQRRSSPLTLSDIAMGVEEHEEEDVNFFQMNVTPQEPIPATVVSVATPQPINNATNHHHHLASQSEGASNSGGAGAEEVEEEDVKFDMKSFLRQSNEVGGIKDFAPYPNSTVVNSEDSFPHQRSDNGGGDGGVVAVGDGNRLHTLSQQHYNAAGSVDEDDKDDKAPKRLLRKAKETEAEWKKRRER
jgi:hypothetical protein